MRPAMLVTLFAVRAAELELSFTTALAAGLAKRMPVFDVPLLSTIFISRAAGSSEPEYLVIVAARELPGGIIAPSTRAVLESLSIAIE
jgi:hypothetical protein